MQILNEFSENLQKTMFPSTTVIQITGVGYGLVWLFCFFDGWFPLTLSEEVGDSSPVSLQSVFFLAFTHSVRPDRLSGRGRP